MRNGERSASLLILLFCSCCGAENAPEAEFLGVEQGRVAIIDESIEPYVSLLQPLEMAAKTGAVVPGATIEAQRALCRKRFQDAVLAFTPAEQDAVTHALAVVTPFLRKHYPRFVSEPWRFIKVADTLEGGLPHTSGRCIVLASRTLAEMIAAAGDCR